MKRKNKLAQASSPYLQQHSENPVDWHEWGNEALQKAREENKPLIISIGYAACHWCHVMAHESFEDEMIASYMNEHFVCIKIDREERPDIDQIYMEAAQIVSGRGGWPLNAIALPDGRPFYAATYFPPHQWLDVLQQLVEVYYNDFERVLKAAESISKGINTLPFDKNNSEEAISETDYHKAFENHIRTIDFELGGYRKAPKFMLPVGLEFFLQYYYFTKNEKALEAVTVSLDAMALGGIFDQIGGGFARYSTDSYWLVPHFEKMLYDNAQLISLYAKAYQVTKKSFYKEIVDKTIAFTERELLDSSGGFYSSLDADSEHEEGKFYVFTKKEFETVLNHEDAKVVCKYWNISEEGNWENGKNIFHSTQTSEAFAVENNLTTKEFENILLRARISLFEARQKRVRPETDDKILCSWNALMISAYIDAYRATSNPDYRNNAIRTAKFIKESLIQPDGRFFRVYKDGKVSVSAFLDDYALTAQAFIALYQITFDIDWLNSAVEIAEYILAHFSNTEHNIFFYTPDNAESLIARKTDYSDNVIPASASVAANVFYSLSLFTGEIKFTYIAKKMLSKVIAETTEHGTYYANWAQLLGKLTHPEVEIVFAGNEALQTAEEILRFYLPDSIVAGGASENINLLKNRIFEGKNLIYFCKDKACALPTENISEILEKIFAFEKSK